MKLNPEMEHHDPNATRVAPKKTDEIVWELYKVRCLIPGHHDAGKKKKMAGIAFTDEGKTVQTFKRCTGVSSNLSRAIALLVPIDRGRKRKSFELRTE